MLSVRIFVTFMLCQLALLQPLPGLAQGTSVPAAAMAAMAAMAAGQPELSVAVFRHGATVSHITAAQVAGSPLADFSPFDNSVAYHATDQNPLWLRLRVHMPAQAVATRWTLNFSKPFTDKIVLHLPGTDGSWTQQSAGDLLAHIQWAKKTLTPQFDLSTVAQGPQDFYVAVYSLIPIRLQASLLPTAQANQVLQSNLLELGFILGVIVYMVITSLTLAVAYRSSTYAWYAAYAVSVVFVIASFSGLGSYLLWSESIQWPDISIGVCSILATALLLQFCRILFLNHTSPRWLRTTVFMMLVTNVVAVTAYIFIENATLRTVLFMVQPFVFSLMTVTITVRAWIIDRRKTALLWLAAYTPLFIAYGLSIVEHFGYASLPWLPYNAPLYALAFEMPLLLLTLHLHAKSQHAKTVRSSTLAGTDPMTGFVTSRLLPDTMASLWDEAQNLKHDVAVAYIEVKHSPQYTSDHGRPPRARTQERVVRMLRTVAREHDTVAHVDKDIYALIMPRKSLGGNLSDRLSRLIALGMMTDKDSRIEVPLRFHIAVSTARSFAGSSKELSEALTAKLQQNDAWGQKPIRFVRKISVRYGAQASAKAASETLSNFWRRAADADIQASKQPTLSLP